MAYNDRNKRVVNVFVEKIVDRPEPFRPDGKSYTIHQYFCDGTVDDKKCKFTLKTWKDQFARNVRDGWSGQCEEDNYKGKVTYTIVAEGGARQAPATASGGGATERGPWVSNDRGIEVGHAINNAVNIVVGLGPDAVRDAMAEESLMSQIAHLAKDIMNLAAKLKSGDESCSSSRYDGIPS